MWATPKTRVPGAIWETREISSATTLVADFFLDILIDFFTRGRTKSREKKGEREEEEEEKEMNTDGKKTKMDPKEQEEIRRMLDMSHPHLWYQRARKIKRKIVMHVGPTNSGKTHMAMQALMRAKSGLYCAPLRLLAREQYEKMTVNGIKTSLLTGQQKILVSEGTHISCTVEMTDINSHFECAVIDEYQMISDSQRGHAWTKAFLGLVADEIHLCGNEAAVKLIKFMCKLTGDEIEVKKYSRLSPLYVEKKEIKSLARELESGDCVVAFSRKKLFELKKEIEKKTKNKCCIIYGALPPETRTEQAALFNDPNSDHESPWRDLERDVVELRILPSILDEFCSRLGLSKVDWALRECQKISYAQFYFLFFQNLSNLDRHLDGLRHEEGLVNLSNERKRLQNCRKLLVWMSIGIRLKFFHSGEQSSASNCGKISCE
eukprot:TRINITY_DN378_c0_g1_i1.p1 TRINITY_DN378_c0_g1~~TRINITY_DN378_c0_g1_i1.p1  ORF type:complete len:434 (-),score=95.18 TRINITY_DN378_c0_g1_i1:190-1491(-)